LDEKSEQKKVPFLIPPFVIFCLFAFFAILPKTTYAQEVSGPVELTGDVVEYSADGQILTATGNVVIKSNGSTLTADIVEFHRDSQTAYAKGNVRLKMEQGEISGRQLTFEFSTMTGEFKGAKIITTPYYGQGRKVNKVDDNRLDVIDGHITTCDYDKPHFRFKFSKMEMYPGDKVVSRHVRMVIGKVPILYIPRFTQILRDRRSNVILTPGFTKDWGMFLLSDWRYHLNENIKGTVHLDAREKKDIASGVDLNYTTEKYGKGIIRTYYMNERTIGAKRWYLKRTEPTIERERFKVEWRHQWDVDEKTFIILQYYRLSDADFLQDFYKKEFEGDSTPSTFFLLTKTLPKGTLSFRTEARVNRFVSAVERLPELRYDLSTRELWNTNIYLKNQTSLVKLTEKTASPSEVRQNTFRADMSNELSYPMKIAFLEFRPFVGHRHTYYSKTKDREKYDSIRGIFRTGGDLSTKFYKYFDVFTDYMGLDINRLRHIVTPTISYTFEGEPTVPARSLDSFDSIDGLTNSNKINFSLENKLQTKRDGKTVELLRALVGVDYFFQDDPNDVGFDKIKTDIDFRPTSWLTLYFDSEYDTREDHLNTANFDLYINGKDDKWSWGFSKRFNREVDDQITSDFKYRLNQKWFFRNYIRFDTMNGIFKEQEYTLTRDLHAWEMDMSFNETRGKGSEIWFVFRLKAFPETLNVDFGTSFNKRKAGTQSGG